MDQTWRVSSPPRNPALTKTPLLSILKQEPWIIKAQSLANSDATVLIPDERFVPVCPRSGEDYSFSSKWNLFSELVSVGLPHALCPIISLYSVLLESAKPRGASLASYRERWLATPNGSMHKNFRKGIQPHWARCDSERKVQQEPEQERWDGHPYLVWAPVFLGSRLLSYPNTTDGTAFQPFHGFLDLYSLSYQTTSGSHVLSLLCVNTL